MGGVPWDEALHEHRVRTQVATGAPAFVHDHNVRTGVATSAIHEKLNPKGVRVRESRDSPAHPNSVPIAALFDVTGSMKGVPKVFKEKLAGLMDILLKKGYCKDPHILTGAIGDHRWDRAPLQIGQFESSVEIDEDLGNIFLEGNGGGNGTESYQLAMYFIARHTVTDAWEKRGKKGYLFLSGDELAFPYVTRDEVQEWLGEDCERDIPIAEIVRELKQKWHVFFLIPSNTDHGSEASLQAFWDKLLGSEVVIKLPRPEEISETIGAIVGMFESEVSLDRVANDTSTRVRDALAPLAGSGIPGASRGAVASSGVAPGTTRL